MDNVVIFIICFHDLTFVYLHQINTQYLSTIKTKSKLWVYCFVSLHITDNESGQWIVNLKTLTMTNAFTVCLFTISIFCCTSKCYFYFWLIINLFVGFVMCKLIDAKRYGSVITFILLERITSLLAFFSITFSET